ASRTKAEVKRDFEYLQRLWENVRSLTLKSQAPCLVYEEGSLIKRTIRDLYSKDIDEVFVAGDDAYREAKDFMRMIMPSHAKNVVLYKDDQPIFSKYSVESQLDQMFSPQVTLPSGGYIVINPTEALVSIDVNSGRSTKEHNIEDTALQTNLEAADEVARQLRLRDLAGLIVIDFIDMVENRSNRAVERRLKDALKNDRARIQVGRISHFGLMEMSRQRLKPALSEGSSIPCPRCGGSGHIRDTESSALQILRIIQEESMKDNTAAVHCQVPVEVASFLLNEKRTEIAKIELKQRVAVLMVPNKALETPNYKLERLKHDDPRLDHVQASYTLAEEVEDPTAVTRRSQEPTNKQTPVIKGVLPDAPAPQAAPRTEAQAEARAPRAPQRPAAAPQSAPARAPVAPQEQGFFAWLKGLFGMGDSPAAAAAPAPAPAPVAETPAREPRRDGRGGEGRGRRGERNGSRDGNRDGNRDANGRDGAAEGRARRGERSERPSEARPTEGGGRPPREGRDGNREGGRGRQGGAEARPVADAQTQAATAAPQGMDAVDGENRNEARGDRAPRNGNGGRERQPRGEGRERQPRGEGRERQPRAPENQSNNAPADFVDTAPLALLPDLDLSGNDMPPAPAQGDTGETRTRRSRDRYGRDRQRGERGERTEQRREGQDAQNASAPVTEGMMDFELPGQPTEAAPSDNSRRSYFAPTAAA
ncbi:MAG: ribonuclease E/G, partial [Giesbergeria sp.]|nr:ribonuclease E/G [Giesbergeria sp.]